MNLFKKKISFVSAVCPKCGENLELDTSLELAYCQYCGAQCIVENAPSRSDKPAIDKIISFVERQHEIKKKEKIEKERKISEEQQRNREWLRNYWWVLVLFFGALIIFSVITTLLGI